MSTVHLGVDARAHGAAAPARQVVYGRLTELFSYPTADLCQAYSDGSLAAEVIGVLEQLPYGLPFDPNPWRGAPEGLGSEYIRLFEVGAGSPTCPLYGGVLGGDRRTVMEDLLRLYRHFGLSTAEAEFRDLPDSIPTVLEFCSYLTFREAGADAKEAVSCRAAQADLLGRYLAAWAGMIRSRMALLEPAPLFRAAVELLDEFVVAELASLAPGKRSARQR